MKDSQNQKNSTKSDPLPATIKVGAVCIAFLIIGYQAALFVHSAAVTRLLSHRDAPDTVYVVDETVARRVLDSPAPSRPSQSEPGGAPERVSVRRNAPHAPASDEARSRFSRRPVESFPFNPNTVSVEDLMRLGFSEKQAQSIESYRSKGGRFRRKEDFAKSFVVADSVYDRLEPYIRIPLVDINSADSAAFDALPGIGPYFASKMVSYREQLHGYSFKEQLMDIYHFDREKYDALSDLIRVDTTRYPPYHLWSLPEEELRKHPYIGSYAAHGVVLYRDNNPPAERSVEGLLKAGVLKPDLGMKLSRCRVD